MKISAIFALIFSFWGNYSYAQDNSSSTITYLHTTEIPIELKVKGEYVVASISRIYKEDWVNNTNVYESISNDLTISLSCYIYMSIDLGVDKELMIIDEIQTLMSHSNPTPLLDFLKRDSTKSHEMKSKSICMALI